MAIRHIAVFIILAAAYVAWTMIAKRKEAAEKEAATATQSAEVAPDA